MASKRQTLSDELLLECAISGQRAIEPEWPIGPLPWSIDGYYLKAEHGGTELNLDAAKRALARKRRPAEVTNRRAWTAFAREVRLHAHALSVSR